MDRVLIARWESRNGKYAVELFRYLTDGAYGYTSDNCGGHLGLLNSVEDAINAVQSKVESGYFLPDSYKTAMVRVA